jgi:hypothetical protein
VHRVAQETLREVLDRIITIRYPNAYEAAFERLRVEHGHTIKMLPGQTQWLNTFNSYAFALGLVETPRYQALVGKHGKSVLASTSFVSRLIEDGELCEITEDKAPAGSLVLCFNGSTLTHTGLIASEDGRVRSKWGPSELYEHELWEVGTAYGDQVR